MALAPLIRKVKRPHGFPFMMSGVVAMVLCFVLYWSFFSSSSTSVVTQRQSFDELDYPVRGSPKLKDPKPVPRQGKVKEDHKKLGLGKADHRKKSKPYGGKQKNEKLVHGSADATLNGNEKAGKKVSKGKREKAAVNIKINDTLSQDADEGEREAGSDTTVTLENEVQGADEQENEKREDGVDEDYVVEIDDGSDDNAEQQNPEEEVEVENEGSIVEQPLKKEVELGTDVLVMRRKKGNGPIFDVNTTYSWKLCSTRSKHNYIPCIDVETANGKLQRYRHSERSCPRAPPMCLVPLPREGYGSPPRWPESQLKILYKNVAHPKLADFVRKSNWMMESAQYLIFPQNESVIRGGIKSYIDFIEERVPDIDWGKNIRVVLNIGTVDSSFEAFLLDKDVLSLSLGIKNDLIDLAQVALERGFPAIVTPFRGRRLPFPSGVFDAIHCGECRVFWHANGGKLLLEMNRILRPGGYFILSTKHQNADWEKAMTSLAASISWNLMAYRTEEANEVGVQIYHKPESNNIYELRMKKIPPMCTETENPDAAWYQPLKSCLHNIPSAIEQHGTEWPEAWPQRLETYLEWVSHKEQLTADTNYWKDIIDKSYLSGIGINWSTVRNVMDMKATFGGFAAALIQQKVWVMNVVPIHLLDTLPLIYDRGLIGVYHDWCESFSTYPRSYDLLHADHLFSRLKNRCRNPVSIVVEMDRILRPEGWAIIRDRAEILTPLQDILESLHWDIRLTYIENSEGILCAQKTSWRPV